MYIQIQQAKHQNTNEVKDKRSNQNLHYITLTYYFQPFNLSNSDLYNPEIAYGDYSDIKKAIYRLYTLEDLKWDDF